MAVKYVVRGIIILCYVLGGAIFIRSLMSWFNPDPNNFFVSIVHTITEPILAPLRRIIPRFQMIDFSPWVALILLTAIIIVLRPYSG
jgi:YggT family protein